jgi:ribonuclease-3
MRAELESLESRIDHRFSDPELLRRALTHSSAANEAHGGTGSPQNDNEQLEFLGDSILGFLISEALVRRYPESREGTLSQIKSHLVSAAHLHGVARRLDLGSYLELSRGEEMNGGRTRKALLGDALEALIAAIYLDGGLEAARCFVAANVFDAPYSGDEDADTDIQPAITNFKSALADLATARQLPAPRYTVVHERGPDHSKTFTMEVRVGKDWTGQADGRTKKVAAQRAARGVFERMAQDAPPAPEAAAPNNS